MNRKVLIWTIIAIPIIVFVGWNTIRKIEPYKSNDLRRAILDGIKIPYPNDTLIIDTDWKICGNTLFFDRPSLFDSQIESDSNLNYLQKRLSKVIIRRNDYSSQQNTTDYNQAFLTDNSNHKVEVEINSEIITPWNIKVYEYYNLENETISIKKEFSYNGSNWQFRILDQTPN